MINIIDYIMAARRTVVFLMGIVISIGLLTYINIAKDAEPDIDIPLIYIGVAHQGISPEDAERLIVKPLENQLKTIEGLEDMMATAVNGFGSVMLEFDIKFDKDKALGDVREKVDMVKSKLPSDAEEPVVIEFNMAEMPTLVISLSGDVPDRTLFYHAKRLQTKIEAIPGILEAPITGDREDLMEILVSPSKLENYNISLMDLIKSITSNNRLVAAGSIDKGQGKFSIKVPAVYESAQDVYNLVIFSSGEGTVTLGDVAETKALKEVFGEHLYAMNINSTKSMTGHLLGAAGAVEAISSILSIKHNIVPPTINHQTADENIDPKINFTFNTAQERDVSVAMSNTFGFGGHNACIMFKKMD